MKKLKFPETVPWFETERHYERWFADSPRRFTWFAITVWDVARNTAQPRFCKPFSGLSPEQRTHCLNAAVEAFGYTEWC